MSLAVCQAREDLVLVFHLRQPGYRDRFRSFRPLALRPRFSTGLPLSDWLNYSNRLQDFTFHFSKNGLQE